MTNGEERERFHPLYRELHGEVLMRPFPAVSGQVMVSHRAIFFTPGEEAAHRTAVSALAEFPGVEATPESQGIQLLRFDAVDLRIEQHPEFTAFTVFAPQSGLPFAEVAIDLLPEGLLDTVPGKILAAVEIAGELVAAIDAGTVKTMERVHEFFDQDRLVGGWVVDRVASVWSHFRPDERGATRFLVQIHRLTSGRYGRLLQRLLEIENYRMAAMLGVPLARKVLPEIEALESRYLTLIQHENDEAGEDFAGLAADVAQMEARCQHRFRRTASYAPILAARVAELREEQVPGYQTLGEFFDRRLIPAWRLCETSAAALDALSTRLQAGRMGGNALPQSALPAVISARRKTAPPRKNPTLEVAAVVLITVVLAELLQLAWHSISGNGGNSGLLWIVALAVALAAHAAWRWWTTTRSRQI